MEYTDMEFCCSAKILMDFGQTEDTEGETEIIPQEEIEEFLKKQIKDHAAYGMACLIATTTSEQKEANNALEAVGFESTPWMKKKNHSYTDLKLWWYQLKTDE